MSYRSRAASGILYTSVSALIYGALPILTNLSYAAGGNAETFNFFKSAWAVPILSIILILQKKSIRLPGRIALWAIVAGILGKGITSLLLYLSYNYVTSGVATTLHFMYPLFAALIGKIVFKNRLPAYKWAALTAATLSVSLLVDLGGGVSSLVGIGYALASAVVYAAYIQVVDKSGVCDVDPMVFAFYLAVSGSVFSLIYGACVGELRMDLTIQGHAYMAVAAVTTSIVAAACFQQGIRRLGGSTAAFFSLFEPIGSCVLGAVFLDEKMELRIVLGIAVILLALVGMICLDCRKQGRAGGPPVRAAGDGGA